MVKDKQMSPKTINLVIQAIDFSCSGNEKIVKLLIENKTHVNAIDKNGHTALDASADAVKGKGDYM